jgi:hypothetical protein
VWVGGCGVVGVAWAVGAAFVGHEGGCIECLSVGG